MKLKQHPLSAAFPVMPDNEYADLRADLATHGQREYIIVHDEMILDGWHRYRAMIELGKPPKMEDLDSRIEPMGYVLSKNLQRRHLTASQRAVAVAECAAWRPRGLNSSSATVADDAPTAKEMAETAHVGVRTIERAKAAVKSGKAGDIKAGKASLQKEKSKKPSPKPELEEAPEDRTAEVGDALVETTKDNERLAELNAKLAASDQGKKIVEMQQEIGALRGRINGLMGESKEASKLAKYYGKICDELRKVLGVEKASGILDAVKKLKGND